MKKIGFGIDSKYKALGRFLANQRQGKVKLSFGQVENFIEGRLPPSARKTGGWWRGSTLAPVLREAGASVASVSIVNSYVIFAKEKFDDINVREMKQQIDDLTETLASERAEKESVLEKQRQEFQNIVTQYSSQLDELKGQELREFRRAFVNRRLFFFMQLVIITTFIFLFSGFVRLVDQELISVPKTPSEFLPWYALLLVFLFPFVWVARTFAYQADKSEILQRDYFSRRYMEERLVLHYGEENKELREKVLSDYSDSWVNKNPADRLMALKTKQADPSKIHPAEFVLDAIRKKTDAS